MQTDSGTELFVDFAASQHGLFDYIQVGDVYLYTYMHVHKIDINDT